MIPDSFRCLACADKRLSSMARISRMALALELGFDAATGGVRSVTVPRMICCSFAAHPRPERHSAKTGMGTG
jgi:hypothetical protein